jgi:hypothetical protein
LAFELIFFFWLRRRGLGVYGFAAGDKSGVMISLLKIILNNY